MTARKLVLTTAAIASSAFAIASPASAAEASSSTAGARASGLLGDTNDLLAGTVGAVLDTGGELVGAVDPTNGTLTNLTGEVIGTLDSTTGTLLDTSGQLLGTIDATTGDVLDPLGNVIGSIVPAVPVDGRPAGGGGRNPGSPTAPSGTTGVFGTSSLSLALSASRTQRFATVARRGVTASTRCSAACGVLAAMAVDGRTAKRLGIGRGTAPVVVGTAVTGAGTLPIRLSSRAKRALARALPTSRTRKRIRSKRIRAYRQYRSRTAPTSRRRAARRSYLRYRKIERRWISSGRVKVIVAAVGMDPRGRTTTIRRQSLVVKR